MRTPERGHHRRRARLAAPALGLVALAAALGGLLVSPAGASDIGVQVPDVNPAGGLYQHCEQELRYSAQLECYADALLGQIEASGSPATELPVIDRQVEQGAGPFLAAQCHMVMHEAGRRYAQRNGVTLANLQEHIPRSNNPNCSAGFGMGLAMYLGRDLVRDPRGAGQTCLWQGTRFRSYTCIHGLGHAYLRAHHGELERALWSCREMNNGHAADCGQGVYHDYWISLGGGDGTTRPEGAVTSPRELCAEADLLFVRGCWYRAFLERRPAEPVESAADVDALCRDLEGLQRGACVSAASLILPGAPQEHLELCAGLSGRDAVNCVRSLRVAGLENRPRLQDELIRQCETMPPEARSECYEWLGRALSVVSNGVFRDRGCAQLSGSAATSCRTGAEEWRTPLVTFA